MTRTGWRDRKVLALLLYGVVATALTLLCLGRQGQLLGRIWPLGDPGVTLQRAKDQRGFLVTELRPDSPAARLLRFGDRVLRVGDLDLTEQLYPFSDFWRYRGRPVLPGQVVPVQFERHGRRRQAALPFGRVAPLSKQFAPFVQPLGFFLFVGLLPRTLFIVVGFLMAWLVLLRRPTSRDAHLCFQMMSINSLTLAMFFVRPSLYPQPLRWLIEYGPALWAWCPAFAIHFTLAVPEESPLYRRLGRWLLGAVYLPPVLITGAALLATWRPETRPLWSGLEQQLYLRYWSYGFTLSILLLGYSAVRASTTARRRQARTMFLGVLPWLVNWWVTLLLRFPPHPALSFIFSAALLLVPISFAYAILRQGLLDLGLIVRQGLVYGTVLAVGVAGYYLLVVGTGRLLLSLTGQTSPGVTMAATLALVGLLRPVTLQSRRWVDRAFYRDRLETARRLRQMTQTMLALLDRKAILTELTGKLPAVFPARGATLFLRGPLDDRYRQAGQEKQPLTLAAAESLLLRELEKSRQPVSTYEIDPVSPDAPLSAADRELAGRLGAVLWVPLLLRGTLLGVLALGWKRSEEIYTEEEQEALCLIASEAAVALENAELAAQREEQARLQQEIAIGHAIQKRLLAPPRLHRDGFEILSRSEAASEVGGDFYNLFDLEQSGAAAGLPAGASAARLGILLGDVAGKGVGAALFMAVTTTLIEGQAQLLPSPAATLAAANARLYRKMRPPGGRERLFATALYGVLDPGSGELRLANAGQTPPIYWPAGGKPGYLRLKGVPLGALPATSYQEQVLCLAPGDRLLCCSDGFIEAPGPAGTMLGYEGLLRRLEALAGRSGPDLIAALFAAGDSAPPAADDPLARDDRTLVLILAS